MFILIPKSRSISLPGGSPIDSVPYIWKVIKRDMGKKLGNKGTKRSVIKVKVEVE